MFDPNRLALARLYHWEAHAPNCVVMTQPMRSATGELTLVDYTWAQVADEARRMALHLHSLGLRRGSAIALLSKNCAHWLIADLAIWLGGYVSVPLYPTLGAATIAKILAHSDAQLLFVGKLDDWERQQPGVPAQVPRILLPRARPARTARLPRGGQHASQFFLCAFALLCAFASKKLPTSARRTGIRREPFDKLRANGA